MLLTATNLPTAALSDMAIYRQLSVALCATRLVSNLPMLKV